MRTILIWALIQSTIILAQIDTVLDGSAPPPERAQAIMLVILAYPIRGTGQPPGGSHGAIAGARQLEERGTSEIDMVGAGLPPFRPPELLDEHRRWRSE